MSEEALMDRIHDLEDTLAKAKSLLQMACDIDHWEDDRDTILRVVSDGLSVGDRPIRP